jgi:hypothetical protein
LKRVQETPGPHGDPLGLILLTNLAQPTLIYKIYKYFNFIPAPFDHCRIAPMGILDASHPFPTCDGAKPEVLRWADEGQRAITVLSSEGYKKCTYWTILFEMKKILYPFASWGYWERRKAKSLWEAG